MPEVDGALRALVRSRAAGLCEYCRISEQFTLAEYKIDHVIAVKHGGQTVTENLALCCAVCNRFKGGCQRPTHGSFRTVPASLPVVHWRATLPAVQHYAVRSPSRAYTWRVQRVVPLYRELRDRRR